LNHASRSNNSQAQDMDDQVNLFDCIGEYTLEKLRRGIAVVVVMCSVVGMVAMEVSIFFRVKQANLSEQAAAACDDQGENTDASEALNIAIRDNNILARTAISVQAVLEAVVLVIMSTAYMVVIPVCIAKFGRSERRLAGHLSEIEYKADNVPVFLPAQFSSLEANAVDGRKVHMRSDKAKELIEITLAVVIARRRRFVSACGIVLITFILRASLDLLLAFSSLYVTQNLDCGICDPCQTDAYLVRRWMTYTPEFRTTIVTLSSPLPLVISLWLMMTKEQRAQLLSRDDPETTHLNAQERMSMQSMDLL
jgi:hypothetical protein